MDWHGMPEEKIGEYGEVSKGKVKKFLHKKVLAYVKEEIEGILAYWAHEVKSRRGVYRNGYYCRGLICEYGYLGDIRVPRFRERVEVENPVFPKNSRYCHGFIDRVVELFCRGLSTWSIAEFHEGLITSMTVSRRVGEYLFGRIRAFEEKRIAKFSSLGNKNW